MSILFGFGTQHDIADVPELLRATQQADRAGLDLFSISDHPYLGGRLDAYAVLGFVLGRTDRIAGLVNVTNVPLRPAPVLARTVTSLSALSGARVILGAGAGGIWERIAAMGAAPLSPGAAVAAFEEAVVLIRKLCGGGPPVTHQGAHYRVEAIEPAPVPAPPVWTGSVGARSLAVTGRVADGWIPGHGADWLSDRYRTSRPVIDAAAVAAGRDPGDIRTVYNLPARITDSPLASTRDDAGKLVGGSPAQWIEELTTAVLDHQASGFILFTPSGGTADPITLGRWAEEIAPAVREAVSAKDEPGAP